MSAPRSFAALLSATLVGLLIATGCGGNETEYRLEQQVASTIEVTSSAFAEGERIPVPYTCIGEQLSPPVQWSNVPAGTQSLALLFEDPDFFSKRFQRSQGDAGSVVPWALWIVYSIPSDVIEIEASNSISADVLPTGAREGTNGYDEIGYRAPCPPPTVLQGRQGGKGGGEHDYVFKLYALDADVGLEPGPTRNGLLRAIDGHILASGQLMGRYRSPTVRIEEGESDLRGGEVRTPDPGFRGN